MPLIARKTVILAKIEATYATDPTPTNVANAMLVRNANLTPLEQITDEREIVQPFLGNFEQLIAACYAMLEFEVEIAGSATATPGDVPSYGVLLRACGMGETISGGVSATYKPISAAFESVTIWFYKDGTRHKMVGARGSVSIRINRLKIPVYVFKFTGLYVAVDDSANPAPTLTVFQKPLPVNNTNTTGFAIHSLAGVLDSLSIDLANSVVYRQLVGSETVIITDRKPAGSLMIEATTVAAKDWWAISRAGTLGALTITHGTTGGNKVQIDAPAVPILKPRYSEQDGIVMLNIDFVLRPSAATGNDELSIKVF